MGVDAHMEEMNENVSICPDGGVMVGADTAPSAVIFSIVSSSVEKGGGGKESAQQITFIRCIMTELKSETNVTARTRSRKKEEASDWIERAVAVRRRPRRRYNAP